jgi:hypothetical protein
VGQILEGKSRPEKFRKAAKIMDRSRRSGKYLTLRGQLKGIENIQTRPRKPDGFIRLGKSFHFFRGGGAVPRGNSGLRRFYNMLFSFAICG